MKIATEACEAQLAVLIGKEREDRFDWFDDDSIILEEQLPIAIYFNKRDHLIIRQEGRGGDEDAFIYVAPQNIPRFIEQLRSLVGKK
jgi:hypothetical protein